MMCNDWTANCILSFLYIAKLKKKRNINHNTLGVKQEQSSTKRPYWKRCELNGQPIPFVFDRYESFGNDDLTTYFRCSRLSDVDGIKIFDKDDQAAKH